MIAEGTQFGPYRLIEKIGAGGMGEVYRALDTRLEREVALKLVSASYLSSDAGSGSPSPPATPHSSHSSHERFLREARSAATLNHPNVCSIHDTGEQDGRPYLVMELLRGVTLKKYLADAGGHGLPADEVISFSQQAAAALAAAHAKGIIHRDIKPANLFVIDALRGKRQIKILDFGLAKKQEGLSAADSRTFGLAPNGAGDETAVGSGTADYGIDQPRFRRGDGGVYVTGTGAGYAARCAYRPVQPGFGDLRNGHREAALRWRFDGGRLRGPAARRSATGKQGKSCHAQAAGSDRGQTAGEGSGATLCHRRAAAGGSGCVGGSNRPVPGSPGSKGGKWLWASLAALLLLIAAGLAWWKYRPAAPAPATTASEGSADAGPPKAAKDSLILADFVNHTGDPVFDTTLNQALQIDLEQSPVLNIVSQEHLAQSVKYLGKPADTPLTPAIAREIGEREGVKAILTGTIANLGKEYVITLTAQNTATGDEIISEQAQAPDKEHVLDALGKAAAAIRGKLGEDLASIKKLDTPFGQATTASLEAFRAYALGDKAHAMARNIPEAEGHYLRAVELDPNFAMAYARLGVVYTNSGQVAKMNKYFAKAYSLSSHVSERERLYIASHYYLNVTGNLPKMIETLQESIQTYPGQLDSYVNINVAYQIVGQYELALPYAKKAVELQPDEAIAAENLLADYLALGRMSDASAEMARAQKLGLDGATDYTALKVTAYFLMGDPTGCEGWWARWRGGPMNSW